MLHNTLLVVHIRHKTPSVNLWTCMICRDPSQACNQSNVLRIFYQQVLIVEIRHMQMVHVCRTQMPQDFMMNYCMCVCVYIYNNNLVLACVSLKMVL